MAQLFQNDPQWAGQKIGNQSILTIEQVGCLLTSMAMIVNYFGGNTNPSALNSIMKSKNGFTGAWIKSAQVPSVFPQLGMQRQKWVENPPIPMDLIDQGLAAGSLIVVRVDWSADPGIQGHWVVIHQKEGDDYLIWDPWNKAGASNKLTERYGFASKDPSKIILEAIWHGKGELPPASATPATPTTTSATPTASSSSASRKDTTAVAKQATSQPSGTLAVKPIINQLSVRQQPVNGTIIKLLSQSDVLAVIEGSGATAKIGQRNQWLHVRLGDGTEGYVAAWYVQQIEAPSSAPAQPAESTQPVTAAQPATPTETAVAPSQPATTIAVKTTVNLVSFRSEPRVANDTFISTLPTGTQLTAIDGDAATKIGKQGQWLQVRASDGKEGYVAAWLVAKN